MSSLREKLPRFHIDRKVVLYLSTTAVALALFLSSCSPEDFTTYDFSSTPNPSNTPHPSATFNPDYLTTPNHPDFMATSTAMRRAVDIAQTQYVINATEINRLSTQVFSMAATNEQFKKNEATAVRETAIFVRNPDNLKSEIAKQPQEAVANAIYIGLSNLEKGIYSSGSGGVIESSEIHGHPEMKIIHIPTNEHVAEAFRSGNYTKISLKQPHISSGFNLDQLNSNNAVVTMSGAEKSDFALLSVIVPSGVPFKPVMWESKPEPPPAGTPFAGFGFTSTIESNQIVPIPLPFRISSPTSTIPIESSILIFVNPPVHTIVHGQSGSIVYRYDQESASWIAMALATTASPYCDEIPDVSNCHYTVGITTFPSDLSTMITSASQHLISQLP